MNAYSEKTRENKKGSRAKMKSQRQGGVDSFQFVDNRPGTIAQRRLSEVANSFQRAKQLEPIQRNDFDRGRKTTDIVQCALVTQLATRQSSPVQFQGSVEDLRTLIYQWNHLPGIQVLVQPTDFVGGTYRVRFTRNNGAISLEQADTWVQAALAHAPHNEPSSDESEEDQVIVVQDINGLMTGGDSVEHLGNGVYDVVVNGVHHRATFRDGIYHLG
ncbi:hypothetical protein [Vibrio hangzhouensis]|uniref:Uncharacterized protein n=1 Tax=Vibrio hangzhouensis TaxID=462991 RepID=A0A1H5W1H2_9VIBR|nr:hypothetical protein [Vibrio hangzhouensis]SEF93389.1 hypothetical protein SAMN04488244_105101 [Vibrio hangzhouensis]